jgi:hypothetical protein
MVRLFALEFIEQLALRIIQFQLIQQIGTFQPGITQGLLVSPPGNRLMIATQ